MRNSIIKIIVASIIMFIGCFFIIWSNHNFEFNLVWNLFLISLKSYPYMLAIVIFAFLIKNNIN